MNEHPRVVVNERVRVGDTVYVATHEGEVIWVKWQKVWRPWVRGENGAKHREMPVMGWLTRALEELNTIPTLESPE